MKSTILEIGSSSLFICRFASVTKPHSATASDTVSVTAIPASHFAFRKFSVIFITVIWFALLPVLTQRGISLFSSI